MPFSHQCTKNHDHMISNSQNMMWIALQVILGHLCLLPNFWPKKSTYLKKRKKHLDISSFYTCIPKFLKNDAKALQVILGQFSPFCSIFGPKLKFSKNEKVPETY